MVDDKEKRKPTSKGTAPLEEAETAEDGRSEQGASTDTRQSSEAATDESPEEPTFAARHPLLRHRPAAGRESESNTSQFGSSLRSAMSALASQYDHPRKRSASFPGTISCSWARSLTGGPLGLHSSRFSGTSIHGLGPPLSSSQRRQRLARLLDEAIRIGEDFDFEDSGDQEDDNTSTSCEDEQDDEQQ